MFFFICYISDPPRVTVFLANKDPSRVATRAEGQNCTLKCTADAKPLVTSFAWYKNVSFLFFLKWFMFLVVLVGDI